MIIEACVENVNEAILAEAQGANRVELCFNLSVGGTTPSSSEIALTKKHLQIPVMVLIRPRGDNFFYSKDEIIEIKRDIKVCKNIGVRGVVIGFLAKEGNIDIDLTNKMVELARPLEVTFHKAIDHTNDILEEFEKLSRTDIDRVLTSGGENTALEGKTIINKMVAISSGNVKVIAAGKILDSNLQQHLDILDCHEFHGQKIVGNLTGNSNNSFTLTT